MGGLERLTVVMVNFNSSDMVALNLEALSRLADDPFKCVVCDNGSSRSDLLDLRRAVSLYDSVELKERSQSRKGSVGHGEALNALVADVDTPYCVVIDADCIPLMKGWDSFLFEKMSDKIKIAGTPLAWNTPPTKKHKDFPLVFLALLEMKSHKPLGVDFRPRDVSAGLDTGWELREKYKGAGWESFTLHGENTRQYKKGPFADTICDEYYTDANKQVLFCSHFGRGSNTLSGKYEKDRTNRWKDAVQHRDDKKAWMQTCSRLLETQMSESAHPSPGGAHVRGGAEKKQIALRMDDVGASTKKYEVYSKKLAGMGNWLFLKYIPGLKAWGPYREMTVKEWEQVYAVLIRHEACLTVAVTAAWVEADGTLTGFPDRFPGEAGILKEGVEAGLVEVANHGLTHCVVGKHLPRPFSSNRKAHREFWDWLPDEIHAEHVRKSQALLQDYFGVSVTTLVPPGNVFSTDTVRAAEENGITLINCNNPEAGEGKVRTLGNDSVRDFHDRDIVMNGVDWFEDVLRDLAGSHEFCFVRDL